MQQDRTLRSSAHAAGGWPGFRDAARSRKATVAWGLVAVGIVVALFGYPQAHSLIDRPEPATGPAGVVLLLLVLAWIAAVVLTLVVQPRAVRSLLVAGMLVALPFAVVVVIVTEAGYGLGLLGAGLVMLIYVYPSLGALALGAFAVASYVWTKGRAAAAVQIVHWVGVTILSVFALAALWLLVTLPRQERLAREAHEIPGLGFGLFLGILLLALFTMRRR